MTHCPRLCHVLSGCTKVSWRQAGFESNLRQQWYVQKCCLIFWTHTLPVLRKISGEMFGSFVGGSHQVHDGRLEVKLPEFSIMKLTSSCGNEDAFAQSSTNLTLVASFFPCLFWAHKYLYTSSFGNEIPLRKVMGLHKLQPRMTTLRPRENLSEIRIKSFSKLQRSWIIHESFIPFPSTYNHVFATLLKVRSPCILLKHPFWVQKGWNKDAACKLSLPTRSKIGYKGHRCATGMLRSHICHNVKAHMISN